ncbi:MAG: hypothetical protein IBJ18_00900 [Phycisphaerales bacterium]|nr:hypothetical protein [Phycisphaerales bacterium]
MGVHTRAVLAVMMGGVVFAALLGGCASTPVEIEPDAANGGMTVGGENPGKAEGGGARGDRGTGLSLFVVDQAAAAKELGELTPSRLAMKVMGIRRAFDGKKPESRLISTRVVGEGGKTVNVREVPFDGGEPSEAVRRPGAVADGGKGSELPKKGSQFEMVLDEQGRLVLSRSADFEDRVTTSFTPAMVVLPAVLEVGKPVVSEFEMVVRPMENQSTIKAQGKAKNTVELVRFERLRTKEGEFIAARVRTKLEADLNPAKVVNTTTTWFVPELGVVAEQEIQRVTALGLPVRVSDSVWITSPVKREGDTEQK